MSLRFQKALRVARWYASGILASGAVVLGVSKAMAASVVIITSPAAIPANSPVVHFEGLFNSGFGGPVFTGPYTEAGMTLDQAQIPAFPDGVNGSLAAVTKGPFIFPPPMNTVTWMAAGEAKEVTLYSDAAGITSIGTFDISNPAYVPQPFSLEFQGFHSDTPFFRMTLQIDSATHFLDDLTFANVPEPGAGMLLAGGIVILVYVRRRFVRS